MAFYRLFNSANVMDDVFVLFCKRKMFTKNGVLTTLLLCKILVCFRLKGLNCFAGKGREMLQVLHIIKVVLIVES